MVKLIADLSQLPASQYPIPHRGDSAIISVEETVFLFKTTSGRAPLVQKTCIKVSASRCCSEVDHPFPNGCDASPRPVPPEPRD